MASFAEFLALAEEVAEASAFEESKSQLKDSIVT